MGYQDGEAIDQAIVDARRAITPELLADIYLKALNQTCSTYATLLDRATVASTTKRLGARRAKAIAALDVTAGNKALDRQVVAAARAQAGHPTVALAPAGSKLETKLNHAGVSACVASRTS